MTTAKTNPVSVGFEQFARPLLELIHHVTGLETSFITEIDWAAQQQKVVLALNTSELDVAERSVIEWSDSMCRLSFLASMEQSSDVAADFPGSVGAEQLNMRTFFALPILVGDATLGTVCGASRRAVELDPAVMTTLRLVAEALSFHMQAQVQVRINEERATRAEAESLIDFLTGLSNRRAFNARFEEELARSGRHGSPVAVLAIDLDDFKAVNDTHGHDRGDAVLISLANVLRRVARVEDVPARVGGDEFCLLLSGCVSAGAETVAARIAVAFRNDTERLEMPCTVSIGIGSSETTHRVSLLATADAALYRQKASRLVGAAPAERSTLRAAGRCEARRQPRQPRAS